MLYKGSRSDNSIVGNILRGEKSSTYLSLLDFLVNKKSLSPEQAREYLDSKGYKEVGYKPGGELHGSKYITVRPKFRKNSWAARNIQGKDEYKNSVKSYDPEIVGQKNGKIPRYTLDHEIGHYEAARDPKSYNRKFQLDNVNGKWDGDSDEDLRTEIRSEQESWVQARRIANGDEGRQKESWLDKFRRGTSMDTYIRTNEATAQINRMKKDPKYAAKMLGRTALKASGTGLGAYAGNKYSLRKVKKLVNRREELSNIPQNKLTASQIKELASLNKKIKAAQYIGTGAGAYLGYRGSKALSKKLIKLD